MQKPKISVIIPVYNAEKYIVECLNSILSQTISEIEVICINDGSIDKSIDILQRYEKKDTRIVVMNQENKGAGEARNNGINSANGDFLFFIDSDDFLPTKETLEILYTKAIENNVSVCGGEIALYDMKTKVLSQDFFDTWGDSKFIFQKSQKMKYRNYQFDFGFTRFIYSTKMINDHNIRFPKKKSFEDPIFFVRAMYAAKEFYALDKIVYCYRQSHKKNTVKPEAAEAILSGLIENVVFSSKAKLKNLKRTTLSRLSANIKIFKRCFKSYNKKMLVAISNSEKERLTLFYTIFIGHHLTSIRQSLTKPIRNILLLLKTLCIKFCLEKGNTNKILILDTRGLHIKNLLPYIKFFNEIHYNVDIITVHNLFERKVFFSLASNLNIKLFQIKSKKAAKYLLKIIPTKTYSHIIVSNTSYYAGSISKTIDSYPELTQHPSILSVEQFQECDTSHNIETTSDLIFYDIQRKIEVTSSDLAMGIKKI